ncbi:MAG: isoprenyl transferase [Proteobacteria bacterium]|jgi:undecaprenyl diphosphate synthase|nr:isoprenyl transferase [Desulfocapsa sp.]MBU3943547.1 isoprenyl transferase [Pseudomonadota bacterium]MCG2743435.1 isoprenyl transferase [Desulfobacteraceae bacterium]MBU4028910.1 isoprenyl transferase [Pseudomonadota bacterium]MBU4044305.1 isoprenyl transferase [Pseudomonadota bacterium]
MSQNPLIDPARIPRHVAIIMDGNGRWAQRRHQPRLLGHKAGVDSVREVVEAAREIGVEILTLYAFSSENWKRPASEVSGLMSFLKNYVQTELSRMLQKNIRFTCIGELGRLPVEVQEVLEHAKTETALNNKLVLNLALSYGSRSELTRAVRKIAAACAAGNLSTENIDEELISNYLDTAGMVDPDLLIRTGGEARLSNFLLWQVSYSEIHFTDVMWPDFRSAAFLQAIADFQQRERRFGRISSQLNND